MRVFSVSLCAAALAVFISFPAPARAADTTPTGEMAGLSDLQLTGLTDFEIQALTLPQIMQMGITA